MKQKSSKRTESDVAIAELDAETEELLNRALALKEKVKSDIKRMSDSVYNKKDMK